MTVNDGVDLVRSDRRLVDALAVYGDDLRSAGEERIEIGELIGLKAGLFDNAVEAFGRRGRQRLFKACGMPADVIGVDCLVAREPGEQTGKQSAVSVGADRQM